MESWTFGLKHALSGFNVAIAPHTFYFHRIGRPDSEWTLEEKEGQNDPNAIAALQERFDDLQLDLRAKVELLDNRDKLFRCIEAGMFRQSISQDEFAALLGQSRWAEENDARGRLRRLFT